MSARRLVAAAAVVLLAVLCAPAAIPAGFNGADLIVVTATIALVAIVARPQRPKTPAGGATAPNTDAPHVDAPPAGSLHQ